MERDYKSPLNGESDALGKTSHRGHRDTEIFRAQRRAGARGEGTEGQLGIRNEERGTRGRGKDVEEGEEEEEKKIA